MKKLTCTKCNKQQPISEFQKTVTYATYKGKRLGPYHGRRKQCRTCIRAYQLARQNRLYAEDPKFRKQKLQRQKKRRMGRLKQAEEFLGGKCVDCGTTEELQFDHVHAPGIPISGILGSRWEVLEVELRKCELRCIDCHLRKHGPGWKENLPI